MRKYEDNEQGRASYLICTTGPSAHRDYEGLRLVLGAANDPNGGVGMAMADQPGQSPSPGTLCKMYLRVALGEGVMAQLPNRAFLFPGILGTGVGGGGGGGWQIEEYHCPKSERIILHVLGVLFLKCKIF